MTMVKSLPTVVGADYYGHRCYIAVSADYGQSLLAVGADYGQSLLIVSAGAD